MKLNIFLEHIFEGAAQQNISLEKTLLAANSMGYTGLECDLWRLSDKAETKKLFDSCGMHVESIYAHFDFGYEPWSVSEKKVYDLLETAAYYGTKKVLALPGLVRAGDSMEEVSKTMCLSLNKMCECAADCGITVTLEDFDSADSPCSTSDGLLYFMKNTKGLRYTFDTGNFAYVLENAEQAYVKLREYISHVHIKDRSFDESRRNSDNTNGKADLSGKIMYPCEAGGGYIGISKLIERLISDRYSGSFSVEHFGAADQLEYMRRSAQLLLSYKF